MSTQWRGMSVDQWHQIIKLIPCRLLVIMSRASSNVQCLQLYNLWISQVRDWDNKAECYDVLSVCIFSYYDDAFIFILFLSISILLTVIINPYPEVNNVNNLTQYNSSSSSVSAWLHWGLLSWRILMIWSGWLLLVLTGNSIVSAWCNHCFTIVTAK